MNLENEWNHLCLLCDDSRYDDAIARCNDILAQYSDQRVKAVFTYDKGLIYERMANYSEAITHYKKSAVYGHSITPLKRVYDIYRYNNNIKAAYDTIEEMIQLEPDLYYCYNLKMDFLIDACNIDELTKTIKLVEEKFEESSLITLAKVRLLIISHKYNEALRVIDKINNDDELKIDFLLLKSVTLLSMGNIEDAIKILKELNNSQNDNTMIIYLLGYTYVLNNQFVLASEVLSSLLNIGYCCERSYLMGLYLYGVTLKYTNENSVEYFNDLNTQYAVYELNYPNDVNIKLLRSLVLCEISTIDEALDELGKIDRMSLDLPETYFVRALLYKKAGYKEKYKENIDFLYKKERLYYNLMQTLCGDGEDNGQDTN